MGVSRRTEHIYAWCSVGRLRSGADANLVDHEGPQRDANKGGDVL